jgi:hypothetical protein
MKDVAYVAPAVEVLGDLHQSTLMPRGKDLGTPNDGDFLKGKSLTTVS